MRDKESIAIELAAEYMGINSECQLFKTLPPSLADRIERSVYNRRKRKLFGHLESLRSKLVERPDSSRTVKRWTGLHALGDLQIVPERKELDMQGRSPAAPI